jgi:hypothetical protein
VVPREPWPAEPAHPVTASPTGGMGPAATPDTAGGESEER